MIDSIFSSFTDPDDRLDAASTMRAELRRRLRAGQAAIPASKHCPTCDTDLPLAAFAKDSTRRDGLRGQCRDCGRRARDARR